LLSNGDYLGALLRSVVQQTPKQKVLDPTAWATSGYKPTPTIIEAAQALYRGHRVEDITRADAGAKNLSKTTACLTQIIEDAKAQHRKAICFVTGVPGAGKTLAGLNLVTQRTKVHEEEHAVFLSGNGPLVEVLREALTRDEQAQALLVNKPIKRADATRKVEPFIQNIHHFRDANLVTDAAPDEHVAVFDEAQRAWDKNQTAKFMAQKKGIPNFDMSEPQFLIQVMDRHSDWCTIVCLIGGGQEINAGEAGLTEWFLALKRSFPEWLIYTSPELTHRDYHWGQDLASVIADHTHQIHQGLHLSVSVRSFRAEKLSEFVGALVHGEADNARSIYQHIEATYPIVLTRDLAHAREWLRSQARGSERFGLVASSGASRLKPEGINVHEKIDATYWFLNGKTDVRSCYYLEDPATEFDIQGLELDWVGVCWDADFRFVNARWSHHKFRGTAWQNVNNISQRSYLANAYRVLLTRARQGMVIYIPPGESDPTRPPEFYEGTAAYLEKCGLKYLQLPQLKAVQHEWQDAV
jgi:Schlafen group 3, DNA/RNA helicase domain